MFSFEVPATINHAAVYLDDGTDCFYYVALRWENRSIGGYKLAEVTLPDGTVVDSCVGEDEGILIYNGFVDFVFGAVKYQIQVEDGDDMVCINVFDGLATEKED